MITKTYRVTDIIWDTDGEQIEDLPSTCVVDLEFDDEKDELDSDLNSCISDILSDEFGWLIEDFKSQPYDDEGSETADIPQDRPEA